MASAEHPLKKRKLYEPFPEPPPILHQYHQSFAPPPPPPPPPLSPNEILRRRRNREEIRSLYECYRSIRFCVSKKDPRLMPDFEQAYLSLITASRGCTSVQRIVAELIPRYASYCPTALEAAAKVSINMYNWSLAIIVRGEDVDGVAYQTAKACIFGLVDICCTASYEAPTSSVIQGICTAVFLNVLTFFTSTFEGKDIYQIGTQEILKLQESMELFWDLKQQPADDNEPILYKLFKFRALSLLRIFVSFPKNLLAACFELLSSGTDAILRKRGQYFLTQVTSHLNADALTETLNKTIDGASRCTDSEQISTNTKGMTEMEPISNYSNVPEKSILLLENCFMGMAINRNPSLSGWILSKYKKLCESISPQDISEISPILEKIFGSISINEADCENSNEDNLDPSKCMDSAYMVHKMSAQKSNVDISGRDPSSGVHDTSSSDALCADNAAAEDVGQNVKPRWSRTPDEVDIQSADEGFTYEGERSVSTKNLEMGNHEDSCPDKTSIPKDLRSSKFLSSATRKQPDHIIDDSKGESHVMEVEKDPSSSINLGLRVEISTSKDSPNILPSPKLHSVAQHPASSNQIIWYSDGDPASMDIFPASKQLWLGSLGHDASETLLRLHFEDFGPLNQFLFFPAKNFALIEYRNIMDAVKAREYMQGSSLWGGCLRIKFLDRGLGSRGVVNGVAVGDSCHVYIGKVLNHWAKDEVLHELMKAGLRNPRLVTDLTSESALLLEFWTAEEAATSMAHIRRHRRETGGHTCSNKHLILSPCTMNKFDSGCQLLVTQIDASVPDEELINAFSRFGELTGWHFNRPNGCCLIDFRSYEAADLAKSKLHGARFGPTSIRVDVKTNNTGTIANSMILSPPAIRDSSINSCRMIISQLSSFYSSLCAKYRINQNSSTYESHKLSSYYPTSMKDEDIMKTNTLWIGFRDIPSSIFTDDELMDFCNLAVGSVGSVVKLTHSMQSSCWFVEFSSVDAAVTALKNIRSCPGMFLQVEFRNSGVALYQNEQQLTPGKSNASGYFPSHRNVCPTDMENTSGNPYGSYFTNKSESSIHEHVSPRVKVEKLVTQVHNGYPYQSSWTASSSAGMLDVESRKVDDFGTSMPLDLSYAEGPSTSHGAEQFWQNKKQESVPQITTQRSLPYPSFTTHGRSMIPPPIPASSLVRPVYLTPSSSWDSSLNPSVSLNQSTMTNNNCHVNGYAAVPFIPSSITPLAQLTGGSMQCFNQMSSLPGLPSVAPPSDVQPPLPFSPPPLPISQPPFVPPPPSSPPPVFEPFSLQTHESRSYPRWQGSLSKSGVQYCTVHATREASDVCRYSSAMLEPVDWPARLDVTKRTDFRHVKTTFASTPPHKREVCRLLPATSSDQKGFQDFISYLRQRECAGVIKIPAGKFIWARLLFILPYSMEICSLLSIAPHPAECLIALVLPKETNFEL